MIIKERATIVAATTLLAATFGIAPVAMAQNATPEAPAMSPGSAPKKFDEHKLKSFAVAYLQVDRIKQQYQPRIVSADNQAEKQKIQSEASEKMVSAVNNVEGMSVQEYNSILTSAQSDPSLTKQLTDEIRKVAKSGQ